MSGFPTNPTDGQVAVVNGINYTYSNTIPAWQVTTNVGGNIAANNFTATQSVFATGALSATGNITGAFLTATSGMWFNGTSISASTTIPTNTNAFSVGPVAQATGITVTVSPGQKWVII